MATNAFEDSRISEGTMHIGAQHVSNVPPMTPYEEQGKRFASSTSPTVKHHSRRVYGTTTLTGASVHNQAGESLGRIEDIMIDVSLGRIAYAVLSFGGLFGIGNKYFILPWSALEFDESKNEFSLDIRREVLEKGPGFDKDTWPDFTDQAYAAGIHSHYGKTPYWESTFPDEGME